MTRRLACEEGIMVGAIAADWSKLRYSWQLTIQAGSVSLSFVQITSRNTLIQFFQMNGCKGTVSSETEQLRGICMARFASIVDLVGGTPFIRLRRHARANLLAKLERQCPSGCVFARLVSWQLQGLYYVELSEKALLW